MVDSFLQEARDSITRIQNFDTAALPRRDELGSALSFDAAVAPAKKVITLFQQISIDHLGDLPESDLKRLRENADSFFSYLNDILNFSAEVENNTSVRLDYIRKVENFYPRAFAELHPLISYLSSRLRDFAELERQARAAVQTATDRANQLNSELEAGRDAANRILEEVRQVAAEQGVSQQASYFKLESEMHERESNKWRNYTAATSAGLVIFAFLSISVYKLPFFSPETTYQAVQLTLAKVLIFGTITYMLVLCARNFLSHKHNSIVNKHRQNALLTFNALVEAARGEDRRDVVLTYAASCIFSPQETGYTKSGGGLEVGPSKLIEILPKLSSPSAS